MKRGLLQRPHPNACVFAGALLHGARPQRRRPGRRHTLLGVASVGRRLGSVLDSDKLDVVSLGGQPRRDGVRVHRPPDAVATTTRRDEIRVTRPARRLLDLGAVAPFRLPRPRTQFVVRDWRSFVARVDFFFEAAKLVVEVDGWAHHATPSALQRDLERQNTLIARGHLVLRFTWSDPRDRPNDVIGSIADLLRAQGAG